MKFHLTEFRFRSFPLRKFLKVPFPFVSVKTNFESSVNFPFPLMALCFHVNPYLGLIVEAGSLRADPDKVEAIRTWPKPATVKKL